MPLASILLAFVVRLFFYHLFLYIFLLLLSWLLLIQLLFFRLLLFRPLPLSAFTYHSPYYSSFFIPFTVRIETAVGDLAKFIYSGVDKPKKKFSE
jgi:hypothetical protein